MWALRGSTVVASLVLGRAEVAERGMATPRVVERLDVVEHGHAGRALGAPVIAVDQLAFQRGKEALGHGVVVAVADAAPRGHDPGPAAALPERQAGVLAAVVRVVDHPGLWLAIPQ